MLTIINRAKDTRSHYSRQQIQAEAKHAVRHAIDSDGKLRAWWLVVDTSQVDGGVLLRADYLMVDGRAASVNVAL